MEITVKPKDGTSILKEIPLNLGDYTIFAGENNSGKTHLIKGIIDELGGEEKVIYIPAENIDPEKNTKTGSGTDQMTKAIANLLKITLGEVPIIEGEFKSLFSNIKSNFESFGVTHTSLDLNEKIFEKKNFEKWIKDNVVKSILESGVKDTYYGNEESFNLNQVGQGIQRLIIVSVIEEIGKMNLRESEQKILLFEEPEIYLHPKLKEKLHESLVKLPAASNMKVVVTTHDPYFIQLNGGQNVYRVRRDSGGSTCVDEANDKYLPSDWRSYNEINYQIFDVNGLDYLNELYGYLEEMMGSWKNVDDRLKKEGQQKNQTRKKTGEQRMTKGSSIRHEMHHRTQEISFNKVDIDDTISKLQSVIVVDFPQLTGDMKRA